MAQVSNAQTIECGTPDMPLEDRLEIMQSLPQPSTQSNASPWKVAIWFYHLRRSDGTTFVTNFTPDQTIATVNQYFDGLFEFTICGETNIDDDQFADMDLSSGSSDFSDLMAYVDGLNEPLSENCVRIFLTGDQHIQLGAISIGGYAFDRIQDVYEPSIFVVNGFAEIWGHELGHYFGLPHTFAGGATGQYVNSPVLINGELYSCYQTGDGFCDTPADLEDCFTANCTTITCPVTDPLGVPYAPDPTLLMSYHSSCRNRFSDEQKQAMRTLYLFHDDYDPIRNVQSECLIPQYGMIVRNCVDVVAGSQDISPIVNVPVEIRGASGICNGQNNLTDINGQFETEPCVLSNTLRRILPDKTYDGDSLNGVSTFDLVLISKHILGSDPFENPFQIIAADANNSASVTTFDIVTIRKVILGFPGADFPAGNWRYVPQFYTETQSFINDFYDGNPFDAEFIDPFQGFTRQYKSVGNVIPNSDSWMDHFSLITTSNVAHSDAAWSFTGLKVGDVDCSSDIDGFAPQPGDEEYTLQSGTSTGIGANAVKKIKIWASVTPEVVAWQFGTRYASDSLEILDILPGNTGTTFDAENFYHSSPTVTGNNDGELKSIWYSTDGTPANLNGKVLFEVIVEATYNTGNILDVFQLDTRLLDMLFYDTAGQVIPDVSLSVSMIDTTYERNAPISNEAGSQFQVAVYPVPFDSEIAFEFALPYDETVSISIFDAMGRRVAELHTTLPAGDHQVRLPVSDNCVAGLYRYAINAGKHHSSGKLVKK